MVGFCTTKCRSFSPECWTKVVLQEHAVIGSVYHLSWRYSVVIHYPISVICPNEHQLHSTLCRTHFLWARKTGMLPFIWLTFQVWFVCKWAQVSFILMICPRKSSPSLWYCSTRPVQLYSDAIVAPRKFHGVSNALQVCSNPECRAECGVQFCDILQLPLLTHRHSSVISMQRGSKELNCVVLHLGSSCMEVVLNGIPAFPEHFNPSCHCTIWQCCIATCFMKTFLCTMISCHFNFDPGALL